MATQLYNAPSPPRCMAAGKEPHVDIQRAIRAIPTSILSGDLEQPHAAVQQEKRHDWRMLAPSAAPCTILSSIPLPSTFPLPLGRHLRDPVGCGRPPAPRGGPRCPDPPPCPHGEGPDVPSPGPLVSQALRPAPRRLHRGGRCLEEVRPLPTTPVTTALLYPPD